MSSTIPATLSALVSALTSVNGLQVGRGTLLDTENDFLIVGYDDGSSPAVSFTREPFAREVLGRQISEAYDIANLLSSWVGDADPQAAVGALFGHLNAIESALAAAARPSGVQRWYVASGDLEQPISGEGAVASLRFTIRVDSVTFS